METRMKKILGGVAVVATVLLIAACLNPVGDGRGLNTLGEDTVGTGVAVPDTNLSFVYSKVISQNGCTTCHSGANPSGGMNLAGLANAKAAFFNIAGDSSPVLTTKSPTVFPIHRVQPGSPDSSYLYQKVTGIFTTPAKSTPDDRMPRPPYTFLDDDEIKIVRAWISRGAPL
jgi:hypothetical protein